MKFSALIFLTLSLNLFAQNGLIQKYYPNGKIESEINYMNNVRDGEAKFYYDNGKIKTELTYNNGKVDGLVKEYYPSGILKESYTIQNGKKEGPHTFYNEQGAFVNEYYYEAGKRVIEKETPPEETASTTSADSVSGSPDSTKNQPVVNQNTAQQQTQVSGNTNTQQTTVTVNPGIQQTQLSGNSGTQQIQNKSSVNDSITMVLEKVKDNPEQSADTLTGYETTADVLPEPLGGWVWIYRKLSYPKEAREKGLTGVTRVLAYIDEKGKAVDARVLSGFDDQCNIAARNAVLYTRFKPAIKNKTEIKMKVIIPVEFKLP